MGKKVKEYKSGDFIFAKVKGYPAWPARVQRLNGKKYFVYFYGTGETANLPPNMIFDYAENKDKFLTKTVKRRDFNDGVKQIEHDFANNVPLEDVIGAANAIAPTDTPEDGNDTAIDIVDESGMDVTADSAVDTTANDTVDTTANATQNDTAVEDSDEAGALIIDEGKGNAEKKNRKSKAEPAKAAVKEPKTPKTPRGKSKKEDSQLDEEEKSEEKAEEIVSRSGRKIRPKRYIDEQTEDNATLPSPAAKKRRGASPPPEGDKEPKDKPVEKNMNQFNNVSQYELENMKEPFKPADPEKENILIAYIPSGQYVGIKLWQSRPANYKDTAARLQWDRQAARNALTLKMQLEKGHITPQSISEQLVMDLNLTDEEKAAMDKDRENEEKKCRVQFLKTEMKLIELDAKIKTCLCLERADTDLCLKLLDKLMELDIKPLMVLKHPHCIETMKRMRAYVGNTPSWDLSHAEQLAFSQQAARIRKQADVMYNAMKELFVTPPGLSFWEFFSERVLQLKKITAQLSADELLEMVHEPLELSQPSSHTMQAAAEAANKEEAAIGEESPANKKKNSTAKSKKSNSTPAKPPAKRQNSRKQDEKEKEKEKTPETPPKDTEKEAEAEVNNKPTEDNAEATADDKEPEAPEKTAETEDDKETPEPAEENNKEDNNAKEESEESSNDKKESAKKGKNGEKASKDSDKKESKESDKKESKVSDKKEGKDSDKKESKESDKKQSKEGDKKESKENDKKEKKSSEKKEAEVKEDEPRAKRSRGENKKTEPPPPRSPISKRKSKV